MNERIQELADQAQQYAEYVTPQGLEWFDTFKEKFAELIVRECARVVNNADLEDVEGGDASVLYAASEQVKRHFGVEE